MKKLLLLLAMAILATTLMSGCEGVAYSYTERKQRFGQIDYWNARMFVDDSDYFWLRERSSHLSMWYPRAVNPN